MKVRITLGIVVATATSTFIVGCGGGSSLSTKRSAAAMPATTTSASSSLDRDDAKGPYKSGRHAVPGSTVSLTFPSGEAVYVADDPAEGLTDRIASDPALSSLRDTSETYVLLGISGNNHVVVQEIMPGSFAPRSIQQELTSLAGTEKSTKSVIATPARQIGKLTFTYQGGANTDVELVVPYGGSGFVFVEITAPTSVIDSYALPVEASISRASS